MIYLVSNSKNLFESDKYKHILFDKALEILNSLDIVQFDTETDGLDPHTKTLLTIQLGNKENQVVFDWLSLSEEEKLKLKNYFESDRTFLGWNLMFDLGFLYVNNIWPNKLWDGMIAEKLIYLGFPPRLNVEQWQELRLPQYEPTNDARTGELRYYDLHYSLKSAAKRWLGVDIDKTVRGTIATAGLTDEVIVYAANDVVWLEDIKAKQDEELEKQDLKFAVEFECEFIKSLAYSKHCGVKLDVEKWKAKMKKDNEALERATQALNEWVVNWDINKRYCTVNLQGDLWDGFDPAPKCNVNWSSSQQVIQLFEELGIKVSTFDKKTKAKKKSVDAKIITPQKNDFPIIPLFLEYQSAAKVTSTYGDNFLKAINEKTKRIHPELHSIGADSGRISSGGGPYKVNILNLPRDEETRACFVAEKGNSWISSDYNSQESCITASTTGDSKMIEIITNNGDFHSEVARVSWPDILGGLSDEEVKKNHKAMRQDAKGIEFAIFYGGDAHTIHQNKGFEMKEAERIYNSFMNGFPGIKQYQDYCRKEVMDKGYILIDPITRHKAHIYDFEFLKHIQERMQDPEYKSYYWEMRKESPGCDTVKNVNLYNRRKSESERQSINYRIQGRGSCAFKLSMMKLFNWIKANNYLNIVKICVTPYDEINLECPSEIAEEVSKILVECMEEGGRPFCPKVKLTADVDISDHWVH